MSINQNRMETKSGKSTRQLAEHGIKKRSLAASTWPQGLPVLCIAGGREKRGRRVIGQWRREKENGRRKTKKPVEEEAGETI